jgi:hypothetical protein
MLKRSGAFLLTLLYIVTVVGFAVNLHYCGKLITAVKIDAPVKSCMGGQMAMPKMKCCKNKHIDIKIKDAHETGSPSFLSKILSCQLVHLPFAHSSIFAPKVVELEKSVYKSHPERSPDKTPAFITNCTFRI